MSRYVLCSCFVGGEIDSYGLGIDKIDVYSSVSNHCHVRAPVLVRILVFSYSRVLFLQANAVDSGTWPHDKYKELFALQWVV